MEKFTMDSVGVKDIDEQTCREMGLDPAALKEQPQLLKYGALIGVICMHMREDEVFAQAMIKATTAEARYDICKKYLDVPFADFKIAHDALVSQLEVGIYEDEETGRLSDEALDMVVGGSKEGAKAFFNDCGTFFKGVGQGIAGIATAGAGLIAGIFDKNAGTKVLGTGLDLMTTGGTNLVSAIVPRNLASAILPKDNAK